MNHRLCWKMGEQMGWIRKDFMEQLYFSSPTLMLGQFEVSFSRLTVNIRDQNKRCLVTFHPSHQSAYWLCEWRMSWGAGVQAWESPCSDLITIWHEHQGNHRLAPACLRFMLPQDVHLKRESYPSHPRSKVLNWNHSIVHIPPGIHILVIWRACP